MKSRAPTVETSLSLLLIAGIASSASCAREITHTARSVVRDSSGVRIVENSGSPGVPAAWSVSTEPIFRIGWSEGDPQFQMIGSGYVADDGRVLVADYGTSRVYTFSSAGVLLTTIGGSGAGPGEFGQLGTVLGLGGDSILVSDRRNQRVSVFRGEELRFSVRVQIPFTDAIYDPKGFDRGSFILMPTAFALRSDEEPRWTRYPILSTSDFLTADTIATLPLMKFHGQGVMNPILHSGAVLFTGGSIAHAVTDQPRVTWMSPEGAVTQIASWDQPPETATDEHWLKYEARVRASSRRTPEELEERLRTSRRDFGGLLPLFRSAHGDRAGSLWLGEYDISRTTASTYNVVSAAGEWLGPVQFPRSIRILDITDTQVLGVEQDELDVESIVVYRLEKPTRSR